MIAHRCHLHDDVTPTCYTIDVACVFAFDAAACKHVVPIGPNRFLTTLQFQ